MNDNDTIKINGIKMTIKEAKKLQEEYQKRETEKIAKMSSEELRLHCEEKDREYAEFSKGMDDCRKETNKKLSNMTSEDFVKWYTSENEKKIDIEKELERILADYESGNKTWSVEQQIAFNISLLQENMRLRGIYADCPPDWFVRMENWNEQDRKESKEAEKEYQSKIEHEKQQLYDYLVKDFLPNQENWIIKFKKERK